MAKRDSDSLVLALNKKAMDYLRSEDYKSSLLYLQKAEALLNSCKIANSKKLYALTLNNFGCYYKRTENLQVALNFLKKALEVESQPPVDISNLSGTHLNICAILSTFGEHSKALAHSLKALNLLKSKHLEDPSLLTMYVAAHHNAGVEYENVSQVVEAESVYKKGFQIAAQYLGSNHPLTCSLKCSIFNLKNGQAGETGLICKVSQNSKSKTLLASRNKSVTRPNTSKFRSKFISKFEKIRFITGDRLQPMFKKDEIRLKDFKNSAIFEVPQVDESTNVNFVEQDSDKDVEEDEEEIRAKAKMLLEASGSETKSEVTEELKGRKGVQISIATQVHLFDSSYIYGLRDKAAVRIQKHVRGFLARRKTEYLKYQKILRNAEKQAKNAKESLKRLRMRKNIKPVRSIQPVITELIPIAYKDKLDSPIKTSSTWTGKGFNKLTTIDEEENDVIQKIIVIQKNFRGWKVRKLYMTKKRAAIIIQKNIRKYQVQKLYLKIKEAIIFIQRVWRLYLKKFKLLPSKRFHILARKSKSKNII